MNIINKLVVFLMPLIPKFIIRLFSKKYIAGAKVEEAVNVIKDLNDKGIMATVDVLGEETIQALQKASQKITENAVNPLKEQLDIERKTRLELEEREAQKAKNEAVSSFLSRLGNIVPDYKEIDVDPGFASWMEDIDPLSGYARKILFKRAESNGDVGRVAEFFNQFKSERMGIDTHDPLANHVTPTGSQAQAQSQQVSEDKKILSMDAINEFYDDAAKGRYKNNMSVFREKEKLIEKAMMEGRVR